MDNLELQILRGDGRIGHFSVNLSPMRDEQSHVTSLVVVMTDVTDAASLQSKLMHAEKMAAVGQLVSGVAHEVNNPLTAILGFADLLMENPEVPESARKDLRVILQEAQRTKQIVQNLLSFARQMPPQRKALQLNPILRRTVQLRSYDFQSHGVEVIEHLDQELPSVIGDSHQLQQVFLNILNNAYDAVSETGRAARIEIATTRKGNSVEISFRDNGPGITHPDRIFDPFFTTKEVGKGNRPGLEHLLRHCARAWRRDSLPQQHRRAGRDLRRSPARHPRNGLSRGRCRSHTTMTTQPVTKPESLPVLLIEDEPAVMAYVRATLERSGYSVVCSRVRRRWLAAAGVGRISGRGLRHAHPRRSERRRCPRLGRAEPSRTDGPDRFHHRRHCQ